MHITFFIKVLIILRKSTKHSYFMLGVQNPLKPDEGGRASLKRHSSRCRKTFFCFVLFLFCFVLFCFLFFSFLCTFQFKRYSMYAFKNRHYVGQNLQNTLPLRMFLLYTRYSSVRNLPVPHDTRASFLL